MNQVETLKAFKRHYGQEVLEKVNEQGNTLHAAFDAGDQAIDALLYLVEEAKVPINTVDKENNTPLHWAAETGSYNSLVLLIDHLLK